MAHFETIWNESESIAKSYTDLDRKQIIKECRAGLDGLVDAETSEEYHTALGNLLFGLCSFCAHLDEKKNIILNSAAALSAANNNHRMEILDPDRDDTT